MRLDLNLRVPLGPFDLELDAHLRTRALGIYGRSGSGKTSLVETLCGLRRGARGRIVVDGEVWLDTSQGIFLPAHRRRVGYVPQGSVLFPDRNVRANLRAGARRSSAALERQVIDVLELAPLLHCQATTLSGGESQRVALGRAICSGARLLILDEPTASLGAEFRLKVLPFLERVQSSFGLPLIVVSHEPLDLKYLCGEMLILETGRVVAHGPPAELLALETGSDSAPISILRGPIVRSTPELSVVRVGADDGIDVSVAGPLGTAGAQATALVAANQVILSRSRPESISALNVWPARLRRLHEYATHYTAELDLGSAGTLYAELTHPSRQRIELEIGCELFAIVKAITTAAAVTAVADELAPQAAQDMRASSERSSEAMVPILRRKQ